MDDRDSLLGKVRALLAKAANTEHQPEREAFEAKAQALITKYQIEQRELTDVASGIEGAHIEVEGWGNAVRGVAYLYSAVADLNQCAVAFNITRGRATIHLFGSNIDRDLTTTLVDYLLPQLRRSILEDKPKSRMSYSLGWVLEVASRLDHARQSFASESNAIVPTNEAATEAMHESIDVSSRSQRNRTSSSDLYRGMLAGEKADIGLTTVEAPV